MLQVRKLMNSHLLSLLIDRNSFSVCLYSQTVLTQKVTQEEEDDDDNVASD